MSFRLIIIGTLAIVATACSQQDKKPRLPLNAVVGLWRSDTVSVPGAARRVYQLRMTADGMAEFTSDSAGSAVPTTSRSERGTWDGADSLVRVVVRAEGTAARPSSLLFAIRGNRLGLVQFDSLAWGDAGLTLTRR